MSIKRTLDNVLRGMATPLPPAQRPGEPGVDSWGVYFHPKDYDFRTHHLPYGEERAHVRMRNHHIVASLVLNKHPDLVSVTSPNGEDFDDAVEVLVDFLDEHSQQLEGRSRTDVYLTAANSVIRILMGKMV